MLVLLSFVQGELLYAAPEGDDIYGKGDVYLGNRLLLKRIQSVPTKIILSRDEKFYILLLPESETAQERIAYCSVDKGILKIFNLGRDVCVQFVDLSPDGKKILYDYGPYEGEETTTHLYTIEVATGKKKRLKLDTCRAFWDTSSSLITIDPRDSLSVVRRVDLNTGKSSKLATIKAGLSGQMAYSPK